MIIRCPDCKQVYDDAECWAVCPHNPLMSHPDLEQKKLATSLMGKNLYWRMSWSALRANLPESMREPLRIESVSWNGMVTLRGWSGEFAPHLFVVKEGE